MKKFLSVIALYVMIGLVLYPLRDSMSNLVFALLHVSTCGACYYGYMTYKKHHLTS